uniref:Uncharacterized protein n=1 Tax=Salix viminalis TaxID=40686 RepID=A0A6N2K316_SALVM
MTILRFRISAYVIILRCILCPMSCQRILKGILSGESIDSSMALTSVLKVSTVLLDPNDSVQLLSKPLSIFLLNL